MRVQALILAALILAAFPGPSPAAEQEFSTEYKIGPKDLLEITEVNLPEINKLNVRVSEDGKITLPFLGEVEVNNLTKSEVEKKLAGLLNAGKWVLDPQVTVFILEYRSRRVSVLGAVERPGPYELLGRQTVLSIISQAGGMTRDAGNEIIVIRQLPAGDSQSLHIPIEDLMVRGDAKLNIPLEPDDIINIPVDKSVTIYVFGQVKNPGALQVRKSNLPTLLQAIAQAGGFSDRAARGSIKVRRKDAAGKELEISVNAKDILNGKVKDVPLLENDTVYVPESLF